MTTFAKTNYYEFRTTAPPVNKGVDRPFIKELLLGLKNRAFYNIPLLYGPRLVSVGPTYRCNYRCVFCIEYSPLEIDTSSPYYKENRDYLTTSISLERFKRIVDDAVLVGTSCIALCDAGEPLLHPDILKMIAYIREKGARCTLSTNGSLLTPDIIKQLCERKLHALNISLNASSATVHTKVHNINDTRIFKTILENAAFLSDYKTLQNEKFPHLSFSFLINKFNYFQVEEMVALASKYKAYSLYFENAFCCKFRKEISNSFMLNEEEKEQLKGLLVNASREAVRLKMVNNIPSFLKKITGRHNYTFRMQKHLVRRCHVFPDGNVYLYYYPIAIGNIYENSLMKIWHSPQYLNLRKTLLLKAKANAYLPGFTICRRCTAGDRDRECCTVQC